MDLDGIPTIESLLAQSAVFFTGRPDWIKRYLDLVMPIDGISLLDDKNRLFKHKPSEWLSYPIFDAENKISRIRDASSLYDDSVPEQSITLPIRPLYTVHLDKAFTVTAHVRSYNGYSDKVIHKKIGVNPKRLTHSLKAITRVIDQSPVFFICKNCHKLIDANFKSLDDPTTCANNACEQMVKQHFDVLSDKASSYLYSKDVRVDKFKDYIAISIGLITWPHPHEPSFKWVIQQKMHLDSSPRQIKSAAKTVHDSKVYSGRCKHCQKSMNKGHMFDHNTCHSCATDLYGVIY
ncbi:hypothetical protein [Shewanella aegiceratis]|uniref:hypothetical protein n=1 Tax=Shewanella aegiceratis TaxID=2864203 RepID=UPI001C659732|nr:hypothetical protein [Shewanella aegiceratis]QYJ82128.1 hypothetical protein K0H80_17875 [Shewanella aegiceratis]